MNKQKTTCRALAPILLLLASCAHQSASQAPEITLPKQWQAMPSNTVTDGEMLQQWWQQLNDPVLNQLIEQAIKQNIGVKIAQAQLRESRAIANITSGNQGPEVSASISTNRAKGSSQSGSGSSRTSYHAGFDASWEPDIFGAQKNEVKAAEADVEASQEALHNTRISMIAEVAKNYVELRVNQYRLFIAQSNVSALEETYNIAQWQYEAGLLSALDVALSQTQLEQAKANVPLMNGLITANKNALAVLLGEMPSDLNNKLGKKISNNIDRLDDIPVINSQIMVGIPANTLRQRPDVKISERRLAAQTARLSAAEAARYPSLHLTGSIGVEALTLSGLQNSGAGAYSLMAGIAAPIFDAGRIRNNIKRQDALLEQAQLNYQSTLLVAVSDIENTLVSLTNNQQRKDGLLSAATAAKNSLELTQYQYQSGLIDFQTLLTNQRNLLTIQDQLASVVGDYSLSQIQLYKALGGGWQLPAESNNKESL